MARCGNCKAQGTVAEIRDCYARRYLDQAQQAEEIAAEQAVERHLENGWANGSDVYWSNAFAAHEAEQERAAFLATGP